MNSETAGPGAGDAPRRAREGEVVLRLRRRLSVARPDAEAHDAPRDEPGDDGEYPCSDVEEDLVEIRHRGPLVAGRLGRARGHRGYRSGSDGEAHASHRGKGTSS